MNHIEKAIQTQKSLNACCGSTEEMFIVAGFRAAIEASKEIEDRLGFTQEVSKELVCELNRYIAHEKFLREEAMRKIGL